jgi:hypothetical protein
VPRNYARQPGSGASINPGERYTVVRGDTLFGIAARLNERPAGATWAAARMLFDTNPNAFIAGDRDQLKLGAVLNIPGSELIASLKADAGFGAPSAPSGPEPERNLPARPALVRNEQTMQATTQDSRVNSDNMNDSGESPMPYALQAAALAAANSANDAPPAAPVRNQTTSATTDSSQRTDAKQRAVTPAKAGPQTISYPMGEPTSPLIAGLIGMLLGALFATLLFSARRIIDSFKRDAWNEEEATEQFNAFDTTDTLDAYELELPAAQRASAAPLTASQEVDVDLGDAYADVTVTPLDTDEYPVASPFGTIEVEFSELDALAGKTLGFDLSEALSNPGNTAEQPKLGESPRINLEGLGSNFDLNRELEEMLEEFGPDDADAENIATAPDSQPDNICAVDVDLEDTGEVTQPRFDEMTSDSELFNASQTQLTAVDGALQPEAERTLAIKPFSLGLDLDLSLNNPDAADDDVDFSFDAEAMSDKNEEKD